MNERNVAALAAIIEPHDAGGAARYLAERLAEAGVLVPSVLTDKECALVGRAASDPVFAPLCCRTALVLLAQGAPLVADRGPV